MDAARAMLRDGATAESILALLRASCANPKAMANVITRLRTEHLASAPVPGAVSAALAPFAHEPGVAEFLTLPLARMLAVQRAHRHDPSWSDGAEACLARLSLLPPALAALKLSPTELVSLKRARDGALLKKSETLVHVHDAGAWLRRAVELAATATADMPYPRLALPLLLLSGRRTAEILNGESSYAPTTRATTCVFGGQLKKRGAAAPYEIPLLCDYAVFAHGLGALRAKQQGARLTPAACGARYQSSLNAALPKTFPWAHHTHVLRSAYATYVHHLYACDVTFNRMAMRVLGHDDLTVSLSYTSVELHGLHLADTMGPLP